MVRKTLISLALCPRPVFLGTISVPLVVTQVWVGLGECGREGFGGFIRA